MEAPDQNKIIGKEIAVSAACYAKLDDKKSGYAFKEALTIDPIFMDMNAVTIESLQDCVEQLEAMGTYDEVAKANGYHDEGYKAPGLVIMSKLDPRVVMSVEFGRRWNKDSDMQAEKTMDKDLTFKWFLNDEHKDQFGVKGVAAERAANPEELDILSKLREITKLPSKQENYQPVLNRIKEGYRTISEDADPEIDEVRGVKQTTDVMVWDNGGETADRYTVAIPHKEGSGTISGWDIYGMSEKPSDPQGFNQYSHTAKAFTPSKSMGKRVPLGQLPQEVKAAIKDRMAEESNESKNIQETGEPDQEYDHEFYDAIVKALKKSGYDAKHREFDKYQGVYLDISKDGKPVDKAWTDEYFVRGKTKASGAKYSKAYLMDLDEPGSEYSADAGDYFQLGPNDKIDGMELVLVGLDGKEKAITNPKKSDLPKSGEVQRGVEFEGEPDEVMVMHLEKKGTEGIEVEVSGDKKHVDVSELVNALKGAGMKKESVQEGIVFNDWDNVDFFGVPKLGEESSDYKPTYKEADSPYVADPSKKDKEVAGKAAKLKAPAGDGKEVVMQAGSALAKPESELSTGVKSGQAPLADKELAVGAAKDGKGDVMQGKGNSDDQQKELPASEIKTGKAADGKGKVMGDSKEPVAGAKPISEARKAQISELMKKNMSGKMAEMRKKKMQEKMSKRYGK